MKYGMKLDAELEVLLDLNGDVIVFENGMWVRFVAVRVAPDERRPYGIAYSLTLHSADGKRILASIMHTPCARCAARPAEAWLLSITYTGAQIRDRTVSSMPEPSLRTSGRL
jgi:hypothetical protein